MIKSGYEYHCSAGETFDSVSLALYLEERYAADLLNANPALCHLTEFVGGELLAVPVVEKPDVSQGGRYVSSSAPWR